MSERSFKPPVWRGRDGQPLSCRDKLKLLDENLEELRQMAQDAFEDALLMGVEEKQIRQALAQLIAQLENPYPEQRS